MTTGPAHTQHPTSTVDGAPPAAGTRAPAEQALLAALSVPDKVRLLTGAANWRTHGAPADRPAADDRVGRALRGPGRHQG